MRVRIVIDTTVDDSVFDGIEDGYGTGAAAIADSVRRDTGMNEFVDTDQARIDVAVCVPGEMPLATATTYAHSGRDPR